MSNDQIVLGQNLVWVNFALIVCVFFAVTGWNRFKAEGFSRGCRVMLGVVLVSLGCASHRAYWGLWRWYRSHGDTEAAGWFVQNADWLMLSVVVIAVGYTLHLAPLLNSVFGKLWPAWAAALAVGSFFSATLIT